MDRLDRSCKHWTNRMDRIQWKDRLDRFYGLDRSCKHWTNWMDRI
jgi:hypothetical protein